MRTTFLSVVPLRFLPFPDFPVFIFPHFSRTHNTHCCGLNCISSHETLPNIYVIFSAVFQIFRHFAGSVNFEITKSRTDMDSVIWLFCRETNSRYSLKLVRFGPSFSSAAFSVFCFFLVQHFQALQIQHPQ